MYNLKIISSTVRPGRKGPIVAEWIAGKAKQHGDFNVELIDLGELKLPLMDEPHHPVLKKYEHDHTKNWSAKIEEADAFIFVTAEYDYGYPSPLRNALEFLSLEWNFKAAGIVSYGGISGGIRAANSLKGDLSTLKMVPLINEALPITQFMQYITDDDKFVGNETLDRSADNMFSQIIRWTKGLRIIKENK